MLSDLTRDMDDMVTASGTVLMPKSDRTAVLFVTDEVFLPRMNGSAQIYAGVARAYRNAGRAVCCLSFYRDAATAFSADTQAAYGDLFHDTLMLPGWNRGGGAVGAAGMAWLEASRWSRGNVFATHPFLSVAQKPAADQVMALIKRNDIGVIYFHKLHTMLLLEPVLDRLRDVRLIVDIHDDFVARDAEYAAAYASVFEALPWRAILRDHVPMFVRHAFTHTNQRRSRWRELGLLLRCDDVLVASERECAFYAALPELAGRVRHQPWPYAIQPPAYSVTAAKPFDAGFIGADNVMNLDAVLFLRDTIMPRVLFARPAFRMLVAGTLTRKAAALLDGAPGIETIGRLDDVRDFYGAIETACVPLRHGTGVSVKAIEALSYGCPLVTTSIGVRGLPRDLLQTRQVTIADDPAAFTTALLARTRPAARVSQAA
jgi:glycosyltransferase involved in cell wall biosynthesis